MAWKIPPALAPRAVATALALALGACGGGSTAGPIAESRVATTALPAAQHQPPPSAAVPPATATATAPAAPVRTTAERPAPSGRAQPQARRPHPPSRGAAAPTPATGDGALADAPPNAGDPPPPAADRSRPGATHESTPAGSPAPTPLDERAQLILTRRASPAHYFQQGTVVGTYDGTMEVEARITSQGVRVHFTATLPGGTISGRGLAVAILDSPTWPGLRGSAVVTGGTGRFAGIRGRRLRVTGRSKPDASRARVRLLGTVSLR